MTSYAYRQRRLCRSVHFGAPTRANTRIGLQPSKTFGHGPSGDTMQLFDSLWPGKQLRMLMRACRYFRSAEKPLRLLQCFSKQRLLANYRSLNLILMVYKA